jgi:hypothetical protein
MPTEYTINYSTTNTYENVVKSASWQFLILPESNKTQELVKIKLNNSLNAPNEFSINGFGFKTIRIHPKKEFKSLLFEATFHVIKKDVNQYLFIEDNAEEIKFINSMNYLIDFDPFLKSTKYTKLLQKDNELFDFDWSKTIFQNLQELNNWVYKFIYFKVNTTNVDTILEEIILKKHGVCQDFTHLFCAIARKNKIATRYISGYLHQGNGYFGDSQMHAWAEAYIPNIGWVGFDPTNDLLADINHIKVCHGKDYQDCAPLKGVIYATGKNKTSHTVQVVSQQQ